MSSSPQTHTEIRREDDDELLGFVRDTGDGSAHALSVFRGELGVHPDRDAAERQIREAGLSSLAERWWIDAGDGWEQCWLIEASPERLVAVIAPYPFMASPQVVAPCTPLRLRPPED